MEGQFGNTESVDERLLVSEHVGAGFQGAPREPAGAHQQLHLHALPGPEGLVGLAFPPLVERKPRADVAVLIVLLVRVHPVPGLLPGQGPVGHADGLLMLEVEIAQVPRFQGPFGPRPGHLPDFAPGIVIPRIGILDAARHHGVHQPGIGLQRVPFTIHCAFIVSVMGDVPGRRGRDEPAAVGQGDGGDDGGHVILRLPRPMLEEPVGMVAGFPHHDGRMVVYFPHIDGIMGDVHVPALPFPGPGRRLPDQVQAQLVGPAGDPRIVGAFRCHGPCMDMDPEEVSEGLGHQELPHQLFRIRTVHRARNGFQRQPVAEVLTAAQDFGPMVDIQHAFPLLDDPDAGGHHAVVDGLAVLILQNHLHLVQLRPVRTPAGRLRYPDVIFKDIIHPGTQFHGEFLLRHDRAFRGEPGAVADAQAPPIEDMVFPPDGNLMMLNRFLFFKGQGVRIDVRNPVGGIHELE